MLGRALEGAGASLNTDVGSVTRSDAPQTQAIYRARMVMYSGDTLWERRLGRAG